MEELSGKQIHSMNEALRCQCCRKSSFVLMPIVGRKGRSRVCPMCFFTVYSASLLDIVGSNALRDFDSNQSLGGNSDFVRDNLEGVR